MLNKKYRRSKGIGRRESSDLRFQGSNTFQSYSLLLALVVIVSLISFVGYYSFNYTIDPYLPPHLILPDGLSSLQNIQVRTSVEPLYPTDISKPYKTPQVENKNEGKAEEIKEVVENKKGRNPIGKESNDITKEALDIPNPKQNSKFAYVTLISGIDKKFKYRGFLYNALIMKESLSKHDSTADFIALIGYNDINDIDPYRSDMNLLKSHGVIIHVLKRLLDHDKHDLGFAEMALLKVTPWSFTQYDRVQFFDGDVMPTKNMDCFFQLDKNTFTGRENILYRDY